nr:MAG TPA: hypothetical protein [Bacteriophage sp.]
MFLRFFLPKNKIFPPKSIAIQKKYITFAL